MTENLEGASIGASVERHLAEQIGSTVARTVVRQAIARADASSPVVDTPSLRAFVRGPLAVALSPLVGKAEATRIARRLERDLAVERDWPLPEEDTLTMIDRRSSNPGGNGSEL